MDTLPAIELLKAGHQFPGPYMFKAIGRSENGFVGRAVAAAREAMQTPFDPPFRIKETPGGRHVSVTLECTMQTAEQVLVVYRHLQKLAGLVILW